jgi:hypothetical protein
MTLTTGENGASLIFKTGGKKEVADAATAYGLICRHTRQAPSSHWARPN